MPEVQIQIQLQLQLQLHSLIQIQLCASDTDQNKTIKGQSTVSQLLYNGKRCRSPAADLGGCGNFRDFRDEKYNDILKLRKSQIIFI